VEATKSFNSSTLYGQYGSFIRGALDVAKKEDEKKTKSKRRCKHSKHKKESYP
jgi:hypothetical protein